MFLKPFWRFHDAFPVDPGATIRAGGTGLWVMLASIGPKAQTWEDMKTSGNALRVVSLLWRA